MAFATHIGGPIGVAAARLRPRAGLVFLAAMLFALSGWVLSDKRLGLALFAVALILAVAAAWIVVLDWLAGLWRRRRAGAIAALVAGDAVPSLLTDAQGRITYANAAVARDLGDPGGDRTLAALLESWTARPGALLYRLENRARATGGDDADCAHEDVVTRGGTFRIGLRMLDPDRLLWRIERTVLPEPRNGDAVPLPMLTLGRNDAILFMNAAARDLVGERVRNLDRLCADLPIRSGMRADISTACGPVRCLVLELEASAGRRELFLLPDEAAAERAPNGWAFFDELPVPLLKLDVSGQLQLSNRPARDLLGIDIERHTSLQDLLEGLGRPIADWLAEAAAGRGGRRSEFLRVRPAEREVFVQVTLNRAMEDGKSVLIAVLNDATELKSLEQQFTQSQKMEAIGQLAGGVAHDFNNLLTAISGHCDLLLLRHDRGDADYADLVQIARNSNRAAALVGQLLAYSRKQTLRPVVMDLRDSVSDMMHLLNRLIGEKVTLTLRHDPELAPVRADKQQLEQVLMNLVVNARDAMPQGGDIVIETENMCLDRPLRRDRAEVPAGRYVAVRVIDHGTGIPPDRLDKVFEPFFTTKKVGEGTGLGLSTAYGIIKQTGGFIFADSPPGAGTLFTIMLPVHETRSDTPEPVGKGPSRLPVEGDAVVLLVEDEAPVRAFAARALQLRGFTVLEAGSAEDALSQLEDPDVHVDVFVTDVVMPGMDGPGWVKTALETRPDVRVVFMSGYAQESFEDLQRRVPASAFLSKPFSLNDLTQTVQRLVASGAGSGR
ncbi:ATP-binding protein [Roseovarius sp. TE539]|uniref:hybrid sensor histidine kinase/response regulator n=1 Tax=Roseovarius sp. TE539 TaxID=2249812 RepID=UPI0026A9AE51|nr:ATP-binding protein [Roseovarius sp. TE539]